MIPVVGKIYHSTHWIGEDRKPLRLKVTRIAGGVVYTRPHYGLHDDGTEWLGSPYKHSLEDSGKWLAEIPEIPVRSEPTPG